MCVACYAFSAMTLFTPVTEAPQSTNVQPATQVQSMPVGEETRISIAKMLQQLPKSAETRIFREEFESIQAQLAGVKDDAKAETIINNGLNTLSQRVMAQPNSDEIIGAMTAMLVVEDDLQLVSPSKSKLPENSSSNTSSKSQNWGWTR